MKTWMMLGALVVACSMGSAVQASPLDALKIQGISIPKPKMVVPEPGTAAVLAAGVGGLMLRRRA
ncbi:PEP-CTERM sorting domain-containing protein [Mucisphaera sp.]|uniref:PEP-CTERM sorting domain-containing protein n=1 Tax=Mucisphaera sp. TaxID=2913024 RepID=UPI003D0F851C